MGFCDDTDLFGSNVGGLPDDAISLTHNCFIKLFVHSIMRIGKTDSTHHYHSLSLVSEEASTVGDDIVENSQNPK